MSVRGCASDDDSELAQSTVRSLRCRFLVSGMGGLSRPSLPDIPGLHSFQGTMFHTAKWDTTASLQGKRVGIIGTGKSHIVALSSSVSLAVFPVGVYC